MHRRRAGFASLLLAMSMVAAAAPTPQRKTTKALPPKKIEEAPRPFTFERILEMVGAVARGDFSETRLRTLIQERGLDFSVSPAEAARLRVAGASNELLEFIQSRAKPLPKPAVIKEPPKPKLGRLAVSCAPAECEISVNGSPRGTTSQGRLEIGPLPPGKVVIDYRRSGYLGAQNTAVIEADRMTSAPAVSLEPEPAVKEKFGAELFAQVQVALGGEPGLREAGFLQASGDAKIYTKDGKAASWSLLFGVKLPDRAFFRVTGGNIAYEVSFIGSQVRSNERLKGDQALELETAFRYLRDYQVAAFLSRLTAARFKMLANRVEPAPGEDFFLIAEGSAEKFTIGLDPAKRLQHVRLDTPSGLGSGLQVVYSDYAAKGKAVYPMVMQIKLPDAAQHGIDVRLESLELNPKLKDSDFQVKRRR